MAKGKQKEPDLEQELIQLYNQWEQYKEYGGRDPFYDDTSNMNLLRNSIIWTKKKLEERCGEDSDSYPEVYFRELPPETKRGYMARAGEIRDKAAEVLKLYLSDANFQYLLYNREMLGKKEAENISVDNVLGYTLGLAEALKKDDLIAMRRHAFRPETYLESFARCAEKVKQILYEKSMIKEEQEEEQLNLFQMGMETGRCR